MVLAPCNCMSTCILALSHVWLIFEPSALYALRLVSLLSRAVVPCALFDHYVVPSGDDEIIF